MSEQPEHLHQGSPLDDAPAVVGHQRARVRRGMSGWAAWSVGQSSCAQTTHDGPSSKPAAGTSPPDRGARSSTAGSATLLRFGTWSLESSMWRRYVSWARATPLRCSLSTRPPGTTIPAGWPRLIAFWPATAPRRGRADGPSARSPRVSWSRWRSWTLTVPGPRPTSPRSRRRGAVEGWAQQW